MQDTVLARCEGLRLEVKGLPLTQLWPHANDVMRDQPAHSHPHTAVLSARVLGCPVERYKKIASNRTNADSSEAM